MIDMAYSYDGVSLNSTNPPVAGRYGGFMSRFDPEEAKAYKDALGDYGGLIYYLDRARQQESDPDYMRAQLAPIEEMIDRQGAKRQMFGFQSNLLGAGINAINKIPETTLAMRAIPLQAMAYQSQNIPNIFGSYSPTSYGSLQYRLAGGRS